MEFHVYYYPILILFLANSASAILQRQNELQQAFEDFGDLFGSTSNSDLDDELDNIFQDQPQQSSRQKLGLNANRIFDGNTKYYNPQPYQPKPHQYYEEKCGQKVVPFDDVVKIVKIIFEKFPSICISRMKVCGAYPKPTDPYHPGTHNPYPKPTYPNKPANPYHKNTYQHHQDSYRNLKQNPATMGNIFVRSMDSLNSNSTSEDGNDETREGHSADFEEGNGEDGKERSKRSTGEDDLNFIPEDGHPPHYDHYQANNDYNNHHPYHYPNYQPYGYSQQHDNSPYDSSFYLDPYDQGVKHYKDHLHHKYVNEKYPYRNIYLDPYDQGVKHYKDYLHHKYVNEKYPYRNIYLDPYDQGVKNYKDYLDHKYVNEKYPNAYAGIVYV